MNNNIFVKVGIGVIIVNNNNKILIGKRKGSHANHHSIPGGHLDPGETFEEAAIREVKEETDLNIFTPKVIGVTNNLITYKEEGKHYISIILTTNRFQGNLKIQEPEKCEEWMWIDPNNLPQPHFDASERGVDLFLNNTFYKKYE